MSLDLISLAKTARFIVDNRGKTVPTVDKGIPLIKTNCITNEQLYPLVDGAFYISQEIYDSWFRAHPKPGDIILTLKGSQNGAACLVPNPVDFVIAQDMVAIRVNETVINAHYLLAALRSREVQHQIKTLDVSGVIPHLKKTDFDKLILPYPSREIQDYIGQLYFKLSSKIELLHQQNQDLEELAQTLFKRWFVEFEFPNENGEPYKSSGGKMVESELGEIPEGWRVLKLENVCEVINGRAYMNSEFKTEGTPIVRIQNVNGGSNYVYSDLELPSDKYIDHNDLIFAWSATFGAFIWRGEKSIYHYHIWKLNCFKPESKLFLFLYLKRITDSVTNQGTGSIFSHITKGLMESQELIVPDDSILSSFDRGVFSLNEKISNNTKEIQTLTQLRDTLLPKLMSGELRVEMDKD